MQKMMVNFNSVSNLNNDFFSSIYCYISMTCPVHHPSPCAHARCPWTFITKAWLKLVPTRFCYLSNSSQCRFTFIFCLGISCCCFFWFTWRLMFSMWTHTCLGCDQMCIAEEKEMTRGLSVGMLGSPVYAWLASDTLRILFPLQSRPRPSASCLQWASSSCCLPSSSSSSTRSCVSPV